VSLPRPNVLTDAGIRLTFSAPADELRNALTGLVSELGGTGLTHRSLLELEVDAIVSPANSFGFMDGGLDLALTDRFGEELQERVRRAIADGWGGELPVGAAIGVPIPGAEHRTLIVAPTMRVPMRLPDDTVNPYLAIRAALRWALGHGSGEAAHPGRIGSVAFPGMGTGIGGVSPDRFAWQARAAIESLAASPPDDWWAAARRHQLLRGPVVRDLQLAEAEQEPAHVPVSGEQVILDEVDPLGDRLLATVAVEDDEIVARVTRDDAITGLEVREVRAPSGDAPLTLGDTRTYVASYLGDPEGLLAAVARLPGARRTASTP
jgi:O-acetyl-ADP-ribose deacetylase (regulator of RNase III)